MKLQMYQTYLVIGLIGAVIGALLPVTDEKRILGLIPLRIFNAILGACLLCFLYFVGGGNNPNIY